MTTKLYWAQLGPYRRLIAVRRIVVGVSEALHFLHHDHLESTKAISGTSGAFKYYPFGYTYQEVSNPPTDNLYTSQKRDLSTGNFTNPSLSTRMIGESDRDRKESRLHPENCNVNTSDFAVCAGQHWGKKVDGLRGNASTTS